MSLRPHQYVIILALFFVSISAIGDEIETRSFPLPNHGSIELKVPKSWQSKISQPPNDLPPTIVFSSQDPLAFQVLLTTLWAARPSIALPGPAQLKKITAEMIEKVGPQAVEREIPIKELKGESTVGYYYSITDKAPKPDEYKYMTQGILRLGELTTTFTILTNDGSENIADETIAMLESATHTPNELSSSQSGAGPIRADGIQIDQRGNDYVLTVPVSNIILNIPKGDFVLSTPPIVKGSTANPRYFYFEDNSSGIILSGWFEPSERFTGVKEPSVAKLGDMVLTHSNVVFGKVGAWKTVAYDTPTPIPTIVNANLQAHLVQAGTWVELHLSAHQDRPISEQRDLLAKIIQSIRIQEKN